MPLTNQRTEQMINFTATMHKPNRIHLDDIVGAIPYFLHNADPRPAREQFNERYAHGGGWMPMSGFKFDSEGQTLKYPGDPAYKPLAVGKLRDETIIVYQYAIVAIVQPSGAFEVARMD